MITPAPFAFDDPLLPRVPLKLGKTTFDLCFTYAAIALAETEFRKLGQKINILHALDFESVDATTLVPLLFAAIVTHQPEWTLEKIPSLIKFRYIGAIREALVLAFVASLADPEEDAEPGPLAEQ